MKKAKTHLKASTNVRITKYALDRAMKIADAMRIKMSDYLQIAIHETNEKYEDKIKCQK